MARHCDIVNVSQNGLPTGKASTPRSIAPRMSDSARPTIAACHGRRIASSAPASTSTVRRRTRWSPRRIRMIAGSSRRGSQLHRWTGRARPARPRARRRRPAASRGARSRSAGRAAWARWAARTASIRRASIAGSRSGTTAIGAHDRSVGHRRSRREPPGGAGRGPGWNGRSNAWARDRTSGRRREGRRPAHDRHARDARSAQRNAWRGVVRRGVAVQAASVRRSAAGRLVVSREGVGRERRRTTRHRIVPDGEPDLSSRGPAAEDHDDRGHRWRRRARGRAPGRRTRSRSSPVLPRLGRSCADR